VAVNNEGKTNEATKNVKEPLKSGQTRPDEKQKAKQEKKQEQATKKKRQTHIIVLRGWASRLYNPLAPIF